ncbi:MAG: hypothetical protein HY451_02110 [Parcubacteria group bacterium]|nr:hypothetical protein [Parcubacteria group bacterium]
MFLLIPLILIASSGAGIVYIVWPKIKEIREGEITSEIKEDFWHLIFPELFRFLSLTRSKFVIFRQNAAVDYEKFLRRIKILSLKTHNLTNKLLERRQKERRRAERRQETEPESDFWKGGGTLDSRKSIFKTKENNLIAEIAKSPKEKNLYQVLGALYLENQMYDEAKEVFDVVLELDPNDSEAKESLEKIGKIA